MQNITDNPTFTAVIQCPQDGDDANGANTKVGFQGLANRTARHQEALEVQQDTNNAETYESLGLIRGYAIQTAAQAANAISLNFGSVTLSIGEYAVFAVDSDFALSPLESMVSGETFTLAADMAGWYEFNLNGFLSAVDFGDFGSGTNCTINVALYVNGSVERRWYGNLASQGSQAAATFGGSHLIALADGDVVKIRYGSDNLGAVTVIATGMHLAITQRFSFLLNAPPAAPTAPTDLIDP
jgi:hypothetical protein